MPRDVDKLQLQLLPLETLDYCDLTGYPVRCDCEKTHDADQD